MKKLIYSILISAVLASTASAQDPASDTLVRPNSERLAGGSLPLRKSPPAIFEGKGPQVGVIGENDTYFVLATSLAAALWKLDVWMKIVAVSEDGINLNKVGWVFLDRRSYSNQTPPMQGQNFTSVSDPELRQSLISGIEYALHSCRDFLHNNCPNSHELAASIECLEENKESPNLGAQCRASLFTNAH